MGTPRKKSRRRSADSKLHHSLITSPYARRLRIEELENRRMLAVFSVSNLDDAGAGSLRQAISDANANGQADTIDFSVTGTINIASQLPTITDDVTITGPGQVLLTLDAGNGTDNTPGTGDGFRIFNINDANDNNQIVVEISGLTLTGGDTPGDGGAISNSENLTVTNSTLSGNSAAIGGGIYNSSSGTATVTGSTLSGNSAYFGGGIYNGNVVFQSGTGTVTITSSTLSGNSASDGGGIFNRGTAATVTSSIISDNSAVSSGGGIYNYFSTVEITNSTISGNSAGSSGGGVHNFYSAAEITNSTISGNSAGSSGGGIFNIGRNGRPISGNSAGSSGGHIYYRYRAEITNSTISGNSAGSRGGGISNYGLTTVNNSTLSGNSANIGGGIYNDGTATLNNTIVSGNDVGGSPDNLFGSGWGGNFNLLGTGATTGGANDIVSDNPMLGPLADNGGPTETHALLPGSPAIDAGGATVLLFDQRGAPFLREIGAGVDIGAFELQAPIIPSADFDGSGFVTGLDFLLWQIGFGTPAPTATPLDGDADNDQDVDGDDLGVWESQFGQAAPIIAPLVAAAETMEPIAAALTLEPVEVAASAPRAASSPSAAELADAAPATVWLGKTVEKEVMFVAEEAAIDLAFSVRDETAGRAVTTTAKQIKTSREDSEEAEIADQPWLSEELLERVFG